MKQTSHIPFSQISGCNFFRAILFLIVLLNSCAFFAQSNTRLDSLKASFNSTTDDSLKITTEIAISRELHHRKHDEKKEYIYAEDAVDRALKLKDTPLYARALDNFGLLYRFHRHYSEAFTLHSKAFELVKNKGVPPNYKMIFANNAGVAARYNQKYDTSISYYMKALKIAEEENDLEDIAIASNGIGNALGNIPGREDEVLPYFRRSLKAEKKRENSLGIAMNYLSISDYFINEKNYDKAREYLNKLLQVNKERKDKYGLAITYQFFGLCYLKEGENLSKASSYFENSYERFKALNDKRKEAELLVHLADIQKEQKQVPAAEQYYRKSLELAKENNQQALIKQNSLELSQILEDKNQPKQALFYYKQGKAYEDSMKLTDQSVKIEALTQQYDLEKKESQIQLLQKNKALQKTLLQNQQQKLKKRRNFMLVMGLGLLLVLTIIFFQYRNYKTKKKTNARIIAEEKEKLNAIYERNLAQAEILVTRLRINPHFLFNSLTAITYLIQSEQNEKAIKYLVVFSRYTRMVLETSKNHVVHVSEELKLANYYLTLEENRFEKDFTYEIKGTDCPETKEMYIPPLLIQPFIENAIWHGLLPSKKTEKVLQVFIESKPEQLQVIIEDNGVGRAHPKKQSIKRGHQSMGIQIVEERIALYNQSYPEKIDYRIIDKKDKDGQPSGTRVEMYIDKKPKENN